MCTGRGSNQGPLGPKSDALTTAPLRHLKCILSTKIKADLGKGVPRHVNVYSVSTCFMQEAFWINLAVIEFRLIDCGKSQSIAID